MKALFVFLFAVGISFGASAQLPDSITQEPSDPSTYSSTNYTYYTLSDPDSPENDESHLPAEFSNPMQVLQVMAQNAARTAISLLNWNARSALVVPSVPYQRLFHFGRWINDPTDDSCMNTRAKVLVRDASGNVTYRTSRNCAVASGRWHDPYAGEQLTESTQIQIDHVVPLKHAYMAGAWKWDYNARCLYANFMGSDYHLMSVSGHENMSKGDRSPDKYMPPDASYKCEYLRTWLKIKATWKLALSVPEAEAIQRLVVENNCSRSRFVMGQNEIRSVRTYINSNIQYCSLNKH